MTWVDTGRNTTIFTSGGASTNTIDLSGNGKNAVRGALACLAILDRWVNNPGGVNPMAGHQGLIASAARSL